LKWSTRELRECLSGVRMAGETRRRSYRRVTIDSREAKKGDLFIALRGKRHDGHDFIPEAHRRGVTGFVVSRPIDLPDARVQVFEVPDTLRALHEIAGRARDGFAGEVAAVTGSNGKTTTKEMAANVLSRKYTVHRNPGNFNNRIGLPLTLAGRGEDVDWMVLELGSNAPGEISELSCMARPHRAIITNVSEVHLEGFGNLLSVMKEKVSIVDGLEPGGALIVGGDDPSLKSAIRNLDMPFTTFGLRRNNDVHPEDYSMRADGGVAFRVEGGPWIDLPVIGVHNLLNALAAYALGLQAGLDHEQIREGLEMPVYQAMRMEISRSSGITFINDGYNANPRSMQLAAETLSLMEGEGRKILVLGDMFELGEGSVRLHRELGKRLSVIDVDALVTVGRLGAVAGKAMRDEDMRRGRKRKILRARNLDAARDRLAGMLRSGDIVLFKASRGMRMESLVEAVQSALKAERS
jgi:UDP-N-acetylmuramoyl-tripeptide--D-alanyl-D-alanine ligase